MAILEITTLISPELFVELNSMVSHSETPDPRQEILEYLKAHPFAADTVDGILQWWLPLQRYETAKEVIQTALEDLIKQGVVDYIDMGNGRRVFRLAAGHGEVK